MRECSMSAVRMTEITIARKEQRLCPLISLAGREIELVTVDSNLRLLLTLLLGKYF